MKRTVSTDRLLTLGMALYADKHTMEQRVRGIFGRKRTSGFARALAVALCLVVGVTCFTTACVPVTEEAFVKYENQLNLAPVNVQPASTPDTVGSVFLAGLREAPFVPVDVSERITRDAAAIDAHKQLQFDAAVTAPDATSYPVVRLKKHAFTDAEFLETMDYFVPGAAWRTYDRDTWDDTGAFDLGAVGVDENFFATATDASGVTHYAQGRRGGSNFYYSRLGRREAVYTKSFIGDDKEMRRELAAFDAEWTYPEESAVRQAKKVVDDLGIGHMHIANVERAVVFNVGGDAAVPESRGWEVVFSRGSDGLNLPNMTHGLHGGKDVAYDMPLWERLFVTVDENGVVEYSWSGACEQAETELANVAILSPDAIADKLLERLRLLYGDGQNTAEATFTVTELRLCAAVIGDAWRWTKGGQSDIGDGEEGLLIPAWEAVVRVENSYPHVTTYAFNAVDGGGLYSRSY